MHHGDDAADNVKKFDFAVLEASNSPLFDISHVVNYYYYYCMLLFWDFSLIH